MYILNVVHCISNVSVQLNGCRNFFRSQILTKCVVNSVCFDLCFVKLLKPGLCVLLLVAMNIFTQSNQMFFLWELCAVVMLFSNCGGQFVSQQLTNLISNLLKKGCQVPFDILQVLVPITMPLCQRRRKELPKSQRFVERLKEKSGRLKSTQQKLYYR